MKRKLTKFLAVLGCVLLSLGTAQAQSMKIGYVDTDSVFASLPETKVQQKQLESYGKQLENRLKQKQQAFQQKYQEAVQKVQAGQVTPQEQAKIEEELQVMQQDMQKEQAAAQVNLAKKENELLNPLYQKVREGVKLVAKNNGYTYVLSKNMLEFGAQANDITSLVIAELTK